MRSAWCAFPKETNRLKNKSVHTCPVQTWPGREVFIYSHPYPRYSWENGWEICSNQLEETSPIDRKNVGWWTIKKKTSRSTRHRHHPDVDRQDTLSWIASFPGTAPDHKQHFGGNWLYPMTLSKSWHWLFVSTLNCILMEHSRTFHKVKGKKVTGKCWSLIVSTLNCILMEHSRTFRKVKGQKVAGKCWSLIGCFGVEITVSSKVRLEKWRLFIFISRESKWGTLKSAGNPTCAVPAESHSICTDRRRPGPAEALQVSPTSDTCQSVAILMNRPHCSADTPSRSTLSIHRLDPPSRSTLSIHPLDPPSRSGQLKPIKKARISDFFVIWKIFSHSLVQFDRAETRTTEPQPKSSEEMCLFLKDKRCTSWVSVAAKE